MQGCKLVIGANLVNSLRGSYLPRDGQNGSLGSPRFASLASDDARPTDREEAERHASALF
jgi:hypothetical protein